MLTVSLLLLLCFASLLTLNAAAVVQRRRSKSSGSSSSWGYSNNSRMLSSGGWCSCGRASRSTMSAFISAAGPVSPFTRQEQRLRHDSTSSGRHLHHLRPRQNQQSQHPPSPQWRRGSTRPSRAMLTTAGSTAAEREPTDVLVKGEQGMQHSAARNSDPNAVFFVTGGNRGIGLEMCRQLLGRTKGTVIAACRDPSSAKDLHALKSSSGSELGSETSPSRLQIVTLDLTNQTSIEHAAREVRERFGGRIDLLLNVAAVLGDGKTTAGPERALRSIDREWMEHSMQTNTIGPVMLAQALAPLMTSAARNKQSKDKSQGSASIVANMSARVGSIGDNRMGGWWSYRMSKAALNQATKCMALELKRHGVWAVALHPGTTDTGLSKPFQANVKPDKLFSVTFTCTSLLDVLDSLEPRHTGGFFAYDGTLIPW